MLPKIRPMRLKLVKEPFDSLPYPRFSGQPDVVLCYSAQRMTFSKIIGRIPAFCVLIVSFVAAVAFRSPSYFVGTVTVLYFINLVVKIKN
jgi:hypothetical protein